MKLFVQYTETTIDSYHSGEQYGEWSAEYDFKVRGVSTASFEAGTHCRVDVREEEFEVDFEATPGDTIWVLTMIYSSGDSFGSSSGNGEVLWVFKSRELTEQAADQFEDDSEQYQIAIKTEGGADVVLSNPAYGYFENISAMYVEPFTLVGV